MLCSYIILHYNYIIIILQLYIQAPELGHARGRGAAAAVRPNPNPNPNPNPDPDPDPNPNRRQNLDMHADGGLQRLFDEAWTKSEALRSDVGAASLYFWTSAKTICGYQ